MSAKRQARDANARESFGDHIGMHQIQRPERVGDDDALLIGAR
jgi:hypothetical protein